MTLGVTSRRRRRISSVIVVVCVVADFIRHHSASATGVVDELAELGSRNLNNDENELLVAANGKLFRVTCSYAHCVAQKKFLHSLS